MSKHFTLLLLITCCVSIGAIAQAVPAGSVSGKVADTASQQLLKDASISIMDVDDSTIVVNALSKEDGTFLIEKLPFGRHLLMVSFQGYSPVYTSFELTAAQPAYKAGNIIMVSEPANLGTVVVKTPPMVIKGDTTEFNASQFKTKPNSTAEDLLKKMPGMEVAKDGTVKAQGQEVKKIFVDGKRFFGDDPKMATKNLPTDMIDKIQVFDAMSDQSAFSGFDDGERETTINIVTKKDRRKGVFGKLAAGLGNLERYTATGNINKFNGNQQISIISQANNTNSQNFSGRDILSAGAGNRNGVPGIGALTGNNGSGITRTIAAGINYSDVWSPKTSVNGSYFYNNMRTLSQSDRFRETFVANDSSLFRNSSSLADNNNQNHRFNFQVEHKIDSMNSIQIRPSFNYQNSENFSESNSFTTRGKLIPQNDVRTFNTSRNNGFNFNNNILYRHRFAKQGRSLSLNLSQGLNDNDQNRTTLSYNNYYTGSNIRKDTINQVTTVDRNGTSFGANVSYTEPITKKGQLELGYNFNTNKNTSNQETNSYNPLTAKFDRRDTVLSNSFDNSNNSHRVSLNYRQQITKDFSYTLGMGVQHSELTSANLTKNTLLQQSFNNLFPSLSLQYRKGRTKNIRFNYRGNTRQPGINQLQDVINNSNPLNISTGNPALKQEFNHNLNLFYNSFKTGSMRNLNFNLNLSSTSNKIANSYFINTSNSIVRIDNVQLIPGAQYVKPINISGAYDMRGYVNYGFPLKNPKSNINLSTNASYSRDVNVVNASKSFINNYIVGETVRFTMNMNEVLDLNFSSTSTYNFARYSQSTSVKGVTQPNGDYFSQVFSIEPTFSPKSGWILSSDFDYLMTRGQAQGYNQSIPLWNASIAKLLFKKKEGELRLTMFDILNQNKSITRNVEQNYIEDVRTNVLTQYFMLTFTYNIRKFGGNQPRTERQFIRPEGGFPPGPGGGQMRMFNQ